MMWSKSTKLKTAALGAMNGIIFGTFLEIVFHSVFSYNLYLNEKELLASGFCCVSFSDYPLNWWFLPLSFFICVAVAAFVTHQCFTKHIKSPVWFWQIVGIVAAVGYALFTTFYVLYLHYISEFGLEHTGLITSDIQAELSMLLIFYPAMAAFNLIFALVLKRRDLNFS